MKVVVAEFEVKEPLFVRSPVRVSDVDAVRVVPDVVVRSLRV